MRHRRFTTAAAICAVAALAVAVPARLLAQRGRGGQAPAAQTPQASAPIDLTGYWVSVVTEDWRYRMVMPAKGDYASVPLNADARKLADAWDPAKDEASGNACKAYGAANIMRVPGRLHVTWPDDNTLEIDTDAGTQTRRLRFGASDPPAGDAGWQGTSVALWEFAGPPARGGGAAGTGAQLGAPGGVPLGGGAGAAPPGGGRGAAPRGGTLKVVTTRLKEGYLRRNGVPYSENTSVTEYFDRHTETNGEWFTVTTIVEDPKYLTQPFVTSTHFKKEPDAAKWRPTPCSAR
jgi:hypothetical protein